jgi:bifunctional non-homologous end joining protein LigD
MRAIAPILKAEAATLAFAADKFDAIRDQVILYAFDLLELDGVDQRPNPLVARKGLLEKLLAKPEAGIQLNEHLTGDGAVIFTHACRLGLEGIVSKHRDHPYRSGPSGGTGQYRGHHAH